jgi:hypothetical protein
MDRKRVALFFFVLSVFPGAVFGLLYLGTPKFMPYHAAAIGLSWSELSSGTQALILALLRVAGGGYLATSAAMLIMIFWAFRRNLSWSYWAIPLVGVCSSLSTLYATLSLKFKTPASPPWQLPAVCLIFLVAGWLLATPRGQKSKT